MKGLRSIIANEDSCHAARAVGREYCAKVLAEFRLGVYHLPSVPSSSQSLNHALMRAKINPSWTKSYRATDSI